MMSTPGGRFGVQDAADFGRAIGVSPPSETYDLHTSCGESSSESRSPEMSVVKTNSRVTRMAQAEKDRRDKFNYQIAQITSLLSDIVGSRRKVVKQSVLRLAADTLRNEHIFGDSVKCKHLETWSPAVMKFFDLFGGFLLGITCRGRIFLASPNIQDKLGYCHVDLLSQDFYNYVHMEDKETLRRYIYPPELQIGSNDSLFEKHLNFQIRLLRAGARTDPLHFERCHIDGVLKRADRATAKSVQDEQQIRRQRIRQSRTFSSSGNDFVFIGMVQIITSALPARIMPPSAYSEYWTRHLIDGRIVQCDQSISLAAGYMIEEVTGTSAFVFMHKEDVRWVICVLRQMYDQSREFGESYYRLMSRSGNFIYMRTRGFLEIKKGTKKVQSFVCVNNVIGEEYGKRMMDEMKKKYSVIVDMDVRANERLPAIDDVPVEHPKQLERIVMHLVEPPINDADDIELVVPSRENIITAIKNSEKVVKETGIRFDKRKRKSSDNDESPDYSKRHNGLLDY